MSKRLLVFCLFIVLAVVGVVTLLPVAADSPTAAVEHASDSAVPANPETSTIMIFEQAPTDLPDESDPVLGTPIPEDEPTAEATADSTGEPPPVIIVNPPAEPEPTPEQNNQTNALTILYVVLAAVFGGGGLTYIWDKIRNSKTALDSAESIWLTQSKEMQAVQRKAVEGLTTVAHGLLDVLNKVTDGLPNDSPAAQAAKRYSQDLKPYNGDEEGKFKG